MKFKLSILLFVFSAVSLIIGIYQIVNGRTWELVLSMIYSLMFFIGGMIDKTKNKKGQRNE